MQQTVVKATLGRETGSRPARRLRAEGKLPGVIYGLGQEPKAVAVDYAELRNALNVPSGMNTVLTLDVDDGTSETVLVYEVQRDPIKRVVTHADFLRIDPDQTVRVSVPLELIGDDTAVTDEGGLVEQQMFEIEIEARPGSIPEVITADMSIMTLDRRISVADLDLPDGVTSMVEEHISVAAAVIPRAAKAADEEDEALEGEELEGDDAEASADAEGDADSDDGE